MARKKRTLKTEATQENLEVQKKLRLEDHSKGLIDDEIHKQVEENTLESNGDKSSQSTRSLRGKTKMHSLQVKRSRGVKLDVSFDESGQPIGDVSSKLQSFIGVVARDSVKITYDSWKHVPGDVKDVIWETVNMSFNLDPNWKGSCLSSANDKWRQFKTKLTNEFVYARMDTAELNTPPAEFPQIEAADWSAFVISRMSENFKKKREQQQQRRAQYVHPYRLSRKGYAKYASEHPDLLCDDPEINQATLWVEGQKTKSGIHEGDALVEKVTKIDEFIAKKKEGSLDAKDMTGTILESALSSKEHSGRLRGTGRVTQSVYFNLPRGREHNRELCSRQQQEIMENRKRIDKLEALLLKTIGRSSDDVDIDEKSSCSVHFKAQLNEKSPQTQHKLDDTVKLAVDDVDMPVLDANLQGKLVALSLESSTNIAAYGTVIKVCDPSSKLPIECVRVSIDEAMDETAPLPIPTSECHSIGDAVGSHVTWPAHLLKLKDEKPKIIMKQERKESHSTESTMPVQLHLIYLHYMTMLKDKGTTTIQLDEKVFGHERILYILKDDVEPFCKLRPVSYNCIVVYIWHLYNRMSSEMLKRFKFVDPIGVGHIPSSKSDKKSVQQGMEQRARALYIGLKGTTVNQMVLVPCNVGEHWILTIINPHKEEVGLLDSFYMMHLGSKLWKWL